MSDAKHTPGPWAVKANGRRGVAFNAQTFSVVDSRRVPLAGTVVDEADARLIAAAPELLEALEAAVPRICSDACAKTHARECVNARAALAKARGES